MAKHTVDDEPTTIVSVQPRPREIPPHERETQLYQRPNRAGSDQSENRRGGCGGCVGRLALLTFFSLSVVVLLAGIGFYFLVQSNLATELDEGIQKLNDARERETFETTIITDRNGETLWELFGEGKRTYVSIDDVPSSLIEATISVEDDTFYVNKGFDETSIIAALIANYRNRDNGGRPIGGSTITQQLVRHIAFDYEERVATSYRRKVKELFLSWMMTREFEKREILEMYLNEIYYGNLAYGIEAASQTYFNKSARDLTMGEATLLAGLPQSPVGLDPYTYLDGARNRQWFILTLMIDDGVITLDQANQAYLEPLNFAPQEISLDAPHFSVWVRQQLEEQFGAEELLNGGWRITTSLDLRYQQLAERLAAEQIDALSGRNVTNASLVALKPGTGEILAMLGSVDYHDDEIDGRVNVALSLQQPGSTIKPLTYAAAMQPNPETGVADWSPADVVWDVPTTYTLTTSIYTPVNYDEKFHGPMRLREALANSYNIPAVQLLQDVGTERLLNTARQLGITTFDPEAYYGLSLTLGGGEVTPLEMTGAFAAFANGGAHIPSVSILRVEDRTGNILFEHEPPEPELVFDPRVAYAISDMLSDNVARTPAMGANSTLRIDAFDAAVKTGTTNEFRDNWTIGYTPGLAVGVWTGNTDNTPMGDVSGLSGAAPIWQQFMLGVYENQALKNELQSNGAAPPTEFVKPAGIEPVSVCNIFSMRVGQFECERTATELMFDPITTDDAPDKELNFDVLEPGFVNTFVLPTEGKWVDGKPPVSAQCVIDTEKVQAPAQAFRKMFILPPRNPESVAQAYGWAERAGLDMLPPVSCYPDADEEGADVAEVVKPTNTPWPSPTPNTSIWPTNTPWPTAEIAPPTQINQPANVVPPTIDWNATATHNAQQVWPTSTPITPEPTPLPISSPTSLPAITNTPLPSPTNIATTIPQFTVEPIVTDTLLPPISTPTPLATATEIAATSTSLPTPTPLLATAIAYPVPTEIPLVETEAATPTALPSPTIAPYPISEPTLLPSPTVIDAVDPVFNGNSGNGAEWVISSPTAGQTISANMPILGTVRFGETTQFYKIELRKMDGNWVTLGSQRFSGVENGQLETLDTTTLLGSDQWGAGTYQLRLIVVGPDGNYQGEPFMIPITFE